MAASGLEGELATERLSVVVPPAGTAAEESAKVLWACNRYRLPNDNKRAVTNVMLGLNAFIFIEFPGSVEKSLSFTAQG